MILGLDVSTSITGVCLLENDGSFISVSKIDLRKEKEFVDKAFKVSRHFDNMNISRSDIDNIFIEDKLSGFAGGGSSQQVMMKLAAFNGAVTYISSYYYNCIPTHIHPSTIKALMKRDGLVIPKGVKGKDKKMVTAKFVANLHKDFTYEETSSGNLKAGIDDMADAYCVARSGYLKFIKVCKKTKS